MNRPHQRTLEALFAHPISANIPWRDIEALFVALGADISEREASRVAVVLFGEVGSAIVPIHVPPRIKGRWPVSAGGCSSTESCHAYHVR
jgi:hypothetical protein